MPIPLGLVADLFLTCYSTDMSKKQNITDTEWPIMEALWEAETATAADIIKSVNAKRSVTEKTVKSLIRRLIAKDMVSYTVDPNDSRIYHYRALVDQESCLEEKSDSMVNLFYGGQLSQMFEHFVKRMNPDEIGRVEELLARKKRQQ